MYYENGTVKLVWIPKENYKEMKSIMFTSLPEAIKHVKDSGRSDYMLMRLLDSDDKSYRWEVLPYGSWSSYNYGMKIFKNKVIMISIFALTVYGGYKLIKNGI